MTAFDLLFLLAAAAALATTIAAVIRAARGERKRALSLLRAILIGCAAYFAVALAVDGLRQQRVIAIGEPWCFDDWCLAVERVQQLPAAYRADLRIFSRARRVRQRARGAWICLIDDRNRLYLPDSGPSIPLDVSLGPGESVRTSRTFRVPAGVGHLGLVTGHGGAYCGAMSLLVIGDGGCLFGKPTIIRIR